MTSNTSIYPFQFMVSRNCSDITIIAFKIQISLSQNTFALLQQLTIIKDRTDEYLGRCF